MATRIFSEPPGSQGFGELVGEIGNDGAGSSGDEHGDVMRVKDLGGFDDERDVP